MSKNKSLSIGDLERIAERVLKLSDADETEVDAGATTDALTRFANNTIHQNVAEQTLGISIRAVVDGRTARSTTNKTDDDSLRRAIAAAISLARNQPKNPDLLPMLKRQKYQKARAFSRQPQKPRRRTAPALSPASAKWRTSENRRRQESFRVASRVPSSRIRGAYLLATSRRDRNSR